MYYTAVVIKGIILSIPYQKSLGLFLILVYEWHNCAAQVLWCQTKKQRKKKRKKSSLIFTSTTLSPDIHEQSEQDIL